MRKRRTRQFSLPSSLSPLARGYLNSVFTVRGEYTVETG